MAVFVMAVVFMATPVLAATYTGYALPPLKQNNYTSAHTKKTSTQYITNKVTDLSNTDEVTFWGCNVNKNPITPDYNQKLGSSVNLRYNTTKSKGTQVILGMENKRWYKWEYAFVSGVVNFH